MRPRKPNRSERESIEWCNLNPDNWLIKIRHDEKLSISHREVGTIREIPR